MRCKQATVTFTLDTTGNGKQLNTIGHTAACGDSVTSGQPVQIQSFNPDGSGFIAFGDLRKLETSVAHVSQPVPQIVGRHLVTEFLPSFGLGYCSVDRSQATGFPFRYEDEILFRATLVKNAKIVVSLDLSQSTSRLFWFVVFDAMHWRHEHRTFPVRTCA